MCWFVMLVFTLCRIVDCATLEVMLELKVKVKFSHTRYRALGPELIPVYRLT